MDYRAVYETLKSPIETEKLLADPKHTANALLSLKHGILDAQEPSLGYCLMALCSLLTQNDSAWNAIDQEFMDRLVFIAAQDHAPNVVCPALSIIGMVALESKKHQYLDPESCPDLIRSFGKDPTFLPMLVSRLTSSHVQTVFVSLQTINSLLLGLFLVDDKRNHLYCSLREADLFKSAAYLIENKPISSTCRPQLHDLQEVIKAAIRKTKSMWIDPEGNIYHRLTFEATQKHLRGLVGPIEQGSDQIDWVKAGVPEHVHPIDLINEMESCWAGMLDFNDFFNEDKMGFKKIFLEQIAFSKSEARFPLIKASLAVSNILYDIFQVEKSSLPPQLLSGESDTLIPPTYIPQNNDSFNFQGQQSGGAGAATNSSATANGGDSAAKRAPPKSSPALSTTSNQSSVEKFMTTMDNLRPLFFDWIPLHFSGVSNFMRLWQASCAELDDFDNIQQVVRILFEKATQHAITASSSSAIENVTNKLDFISYDEIRTTQLKQVENKMNEKWGDEIRHLHRQYLKESEDFVREQRVRLLLQGDWFYIDDPTSVLFQNQNQQSQQKTYQQQQRQQQGAGANVNRRYFIALSPSRKSLQYSQFPQKLEANPSPEVLTRSIDLTSVNKVTITPITHASPNHPKGLKRVSLSSRTNYTKISLIGSSGNPRDGATLSFYSDTPEKAAAWGDGLLMLKNRSFQSADTKKYIEMFADSKLRMQLLTLAPHDLAAPKHEPVDLNGPFDRSQVSTDYYYR